MIGMLPTDDLDEQQRAFVEAKRAEHAALNDDKSEAASRPNAFPDSAQLCNRCQAKAVIQMEGCMTCLNCGDSKCS